MAKKLDEMAAELGYTPGEFQVRRLKENIAELAVWKEYIDVGKVPPGYYGTPYECEKLYHKLARALAAEERELLPYFYGKKKHVEGDVNVKGELVVQLVKLAEDPDPK